jgi:hypothetical protein
MQHGRNIDDLFPGQNTHWAANNARMRPDSVVPAFAKWFT